MKRPIFALASLAAVVLATLFASGVFSADEATGAPGAGTLFGTDANGGNLITVSPADGSGAVVGPMGAGVIPALAVDPTTGIMYAARGGGVPNVYTVAPGSGATALVGDTLLGFAAVGGMDFDGSGTLYAAVNIAGDGGTGSDHLATINTITGQATVIGPFGNCVGVVVPSGGGGFCTIEGMEGIAFDAAGTLWGAHSARGAAGAPGLYTINPGTGAATFVAPILDVSGPGPTGGVVSLQFACDGTLYGGTARGLGAGDGGFLGTINPATGAFTFVGPASATGGSSLGALAFEDPCPTGPTSIEVSKTASFDGRFVSGTISITNVGENPAIISGMADSLEVHFPKKKGFVPPPLPGGSTPNWFKVADVPVSPPGPIPVGETVNIDYSFDLCDAADFSGANSMRNVVAVTLDNKPAGAQTDTVVTRSDSFKPALPECGGTLFAGTDTEEFSGVPLPDRLAVMTTDGPLVSDLVIEDAEVFLNGLAPTGTGALYSGDPLTNAHNVLNFDGSLVSTIAGPLDNNSCCNEDLAVDPATGNVWRADWVEGPLFEYNPVTGAVVNSYNQTDVVGATFVGNTLWITKWSAQLVGTFDPNTNTFTPMFSTATNAGGLAYDAANNILWVGEQGGLVQAWDLSVGPPVIIAGSQVQPFGNISDTVDGLAFVGN